MANKKAYLVALGKTDSPEFKALDNLPSTVEIVAIGQVDQVLGKSFPMIVAPEGALHRSHQRAAELSDEALAKVDILLDTGFGVRTDRRRAIEKLWPKIPSLKWMHVASAGDRHARSVSCLACSPETHLACSITVTCIGCNREPRNGAGITHILTDDLVKGDVILTNAKVSPAECVTGQ